jgi:hypothetical protein
MSAEDNLGLLADAIEELVVRDRTLFDVGAQERSIGFRLGLYLWRRFPDWDVDCEYNRRDVYVKRFIGQPKETWIAPDLLVHHRRTNDNALAIELKAKPGEDTVEDIEDLIKLTAPNDKFHYEAGVLLVFAGKTKAKLFSADVFREGHRDVKLSVLFAEMLKKRGLLD